MGSFNNLDSVYFEEYKFSACKIIIITDHNYVAASATYKPTQPLVRDVFSCVCMCNYF